MKSTRFSGTNFILILLFIFFFAGAATSGIASEKEQKHQRVLVVNSYHPGYAWSDEIMLGIQDVLGNQKNVELFIEYLDTKRHFDKSYYLQMEELFRSKYSSANIDLVITSDDNALDFFLGIKKEIFPKIPLIFCGIDHIKPGRIANQGTVFGIEEADSTASTIDLILSIHPDLESITFIADDTATGKLMIEKTRKLYSSYQSRILFNFITDATTEELQLTLREISDNTVIFYLSFIRDKNGKIFSIEDSMKLIAENSSVPVYCSWGFKPETGVLGGNILSGYKQGEISAQVASKLLVNATGETIPSTQLAPLVYKFDYQAMNRFNIDIKKIPKNSIVYNRPYSFYDGHKKLIWATLFVGFCLVFFIMALSLNIKRRKKAEAELQKTHAGLELEVEKRTIELTESNKLLTKEIKDRKSKEKALKESENEYRSTLDNLQIGIVVHASDSSILLTNPEASNILGLTYEQLSGKQAIDPAWSFMHEDSTIMKIEDYPVNKVLSTKRPLNNYTLGINRCDRSFVTWVIVNAIPIFSDDNKLSKIIVNFVDITKRMKLEDQLRQSQKMDAIGTLAGGIAHDFNNMLGIITGNVSYAMSLMDHDEEMCNALSDTLGGAKQARALTHQLLTFSRGGEPVKKTADINQLIIESAQFVTRGATARCEFELSENLFFVDVDIGQMNQVISNLVINSNQAMPNGGIIHIKSENIKIEANHDIHLPEGNYVKISVEDQGTGISEKHLSKIFDPFFTTKQLGNGLGLSTIYSIIKKHHGHISVYSELEKGAVFHVYIPASLKEIEKPEDKSEVTHHGNGKALVMDDQEPILKMAGRMLNRMGYETTLTTDGLRAMEVYKEAHSSDRPFDLVLLDLTVPGGMGGARAITQLLKINPDVKAVVSSGYSNDPIMANYKDYGFCGIAPKPFSFAQLNELLNQIMGEKS